MKIVICLLLLLVSGCTSGTSSTKNSSGSLFVFYNNDNFSFLLPCGCRISPIGGMDRRWNGMQSFPEDSRLFLDSGNLLFKSATAADYLAPQWFEEAKGVVEAYNILHADAATVGENEFALGIGKFEELAKSANFPFISANIYKKGTKDLYLPDSVIIKRQGKKIGVFGIFLPSLKLPPELVATDPVEAAKKEVEKLRGAGVDMVIALAHEGYENDVQLAQKVKGIDLIVGASSQSLLQSPDHEGDTTIVQLSSQGQMFAYVEYGLQEFPKRIKSNVVAELNAEYNNPPHGEANPIKNLIAVTNLKIAESNKKLDESLWEKHRNMAVSYDTFLSCRDCHTAQAEFQEGKPHAAAFLTLLAKKQEHNLDCVKCHSVGLGVAGGFESIADAFLDPEGKSVPLENILAKAGKDFPSPGAEYRTLYYKDPKKLRADVGRWIAALKESDVKKAFVGVQCETCHGGMAGHPFGSDTAHTKVTSSVCLQCHTREQMPSWYDASGKVKQDTFAAALKSMTCPRKN